VNYRRDLALRTRTQVTVILALLLHARLPREAFLRWGTLVVLLGTQSLTLTVVLFVALSPVAASLPMEHVCQTILREWYPLRTPLLLDKEHQ